MALTWQERDSIALNLLWETYGDFAHLDKAIANGEVTFSTVRSLIREGIERAEAYTETPEYEWGYKALGQDVVLTTEKYARVMHERWGDKIVRRHKRGDWEEVEE